LVQPSRIFELWQRLYTRFLIEPLPAQETESPGVLTSIQPITDADQLLRIPGIKAVTLTAPAVGLRTLFTVPAGERWHLFSVHAQRTSEDRDVSQLRLVDTSEGLDMRIAIQAAASEIMYEKAGSPYILDQEDAIQINITGGTTDGNWAGRAWVEVEAAF